MKITGKGSLTISIISAAFLRSNADKVSANRVLEDECTSVHETLKNLGSSDFSEKLLKRGLDFKYGQFTIFAPSDALLNNEGITLKNAGYADETINDVLLFHVSSEEIKEDITDISHCGKPILMLNEELHVNQESSVTNCKEGKFFQLGPGNIGSELQPEIVGNAIHACDSVIYTIEDALMMPTLPTLPLGTNPTPKPVPTAPTVSPEPTVASKPTREPTRQVPLTIKPTKPDSPVQAPVAAPETPPASGSNKLLCSRQLLAFGAAVVLSLL
mmetsp:Transcript_16246/g.37245  ORF Transcript_16246/g.37245 Transcript_16246/m.37245 type:complete len:272 (-) Transcript_16246:1721-2536(-)